MKNEKYDNMDPKERDKIIIEKLKPIWIMFGIMVATIIIMILITKYSDSKENKKFEPLIKTIEKI